MTPPPPGSHDRLEEYRAKRASARTPEPFGAGDHPRPRLFVVQQHAATNLHFDLRLEHEGVLLSWAVPRGPCADPEVLRLAMQTEDHPLDYADFEGQIPEGNYGAGTVIVWDQGEWVPHGDVGSGLASGKLLFELRGHKLRGMWTLFRSGRKDDSDRHWMLMKKPDAYAGEEFPWSEHSIFSGLTLEEARDGTSRFDALRVDVAACAEQSAVDAAAQRPMLARTADPFDDDGWIFEFKFDGYRVMLNKEGDRVTLYYRSGRDATALFPELVRAARKLPFDSLLLDGEVVAHNAEGMPSFQRLQSRAQLNRRSEIEVGAVRRPVSLFVFDLLAMDGYDLRDLPLTERKALLQRALSPAGPIRFSDHIPGNGRALFAQAQELELEGVIAKRAASRYRAGRSDDWLKIKSERTGDFVVVGWTRPKGQRPGFGALHLAAREASELVYLGRVGSGFRDTDLTAIAEELGDPVDAPPCTGAAPTGRDDVYVAPRLVAEVRYLMRTNDGLLRHAVFERMRDDKTPDECDAPPIKDADPEPPPMLEEARAFQPTNRGKVFWPDEGFTKGDLIAYYEAIAPFMLPYLADRPVVLVRYPDGIAGKSFFQKDAPAWAPPWLRTEKMWSDQTERDLDMFIADDRESLLFLVNMGTIPFHIGASRVSDAARPDWCVLDLDPKEASFQAVIEVARAIGELCRKIELDAYCKTSGSSGIHVLLPLGGAFTFEQSKTLAELIARVVEAEVPTIATTERSLKKRDGKVYLDTVQNGPGKLIVAPFSVRPRPGATVSAPLRWDELTPTLTIEQFTIRSMPERMESFQAVDPMAPILTTRPDLMAALTRLSEML